MRRYFGTDGVRGVVGETITVDLVERLGGAVTRWIGGGSLFVGRDTRGSGPELEAAFARGGVSGGGAASAGGTAVLGGVLPTPAIALAALDAGIVISASHNPPEYNGVKIFDREGEKLTDDQEEQIEGLLCVRASGEGGRSYAKADGATEYMEYVLEHFGSD